MRYDRMNLNLSQGSRINDVQKPIDSTFLYSDVSWGFELSEGDRPADAFLPERFAPSVRTIKTQSLHRKAVIIPKGTILAAHPVMNQNHYWLTQDPYNSGIVPGSGQTRSGQVALGIGYDNGVIASDIDDMIGGYDNIRLAGVIANGGARVADKYRAFDVERGRVKRDGTLAVADELYLRPANIPIGVVTEDTFVWDEGNKLNFNEISWNPFRSYATDFMVEMPYCSNEAAYNMDISVDGGTGEQTMGVGYAAAWALGMPFYTAPTFADMVIGNWAKPDENGKFTAEYTAAQLVAASFAVNKTGQTVGKLNSFTNKFPYDMEGLVETFHTTRTGGTATFGIEYRLYVFMQAILAATLGHAPTYVDFKHALDSGDFGMARLNLHVA